MKSKFRYIIHSITIAFGILSALKILFEIEIFSMRYMIWVIALWTIMDFTLYPLVNVNKIKSIVNFKKSK